MGGMFHTSKILCDFKLDGFVGVHVKCCLRGQHGEILLDHAVNEENDQVDFKFVEQGNMWYRKIGILGMVKW